MAREAAQCTVRNAVAAQVDGQMWSWRSGASVIDVLLPCRRPFFMLCSVDRAIAMRLILRQPSPTWLRFSIEELQLCPGDQEIPSCDPWLPGQLSLLPTLDGISKDLQWHQEHQAATSEHPAIPLLCICDTRKDKKAVWRTSRKVSLSDSHIHHPKSGQETFVWWMAVIIVASSPTHKFSKH
uniref:uncharacterized protein LOC114591484 isoform X5 n=1 Tax=Podarcis muralis TaxID=64176 RepID=UPI0010A00CEF|nr:uncharacterized protein LOC114591484 isoform X5 [Podarcis muralis]